MDLAAGRVARLECLAQHFVLCHTGPRRARERGEHGVADGTGVAQALDFFRQLVLPRFEHGEITFAARLDLPLRERRLDIGLLLQHLIHRHNLQGHRLVDRIAPEAMRLLLDYHWPGNVRELNNVVEYAYAVGRGGELGIADLPPEFREPVRSQMPQPAQPLSRPKPAAEEALIREALEIGAGNLEQAARYAGMSRATFWRKRKKYRL